MNLLLLLSDDDFVDNEIEYYSCRVRRIVEQSDAALYQGKQGFKIIKNRHEQVKDCSSLDAFVQEFVGEIRSKTQSGLVRVVRPMGRVPHA